MFLKSVWLGAGFAGISLLRGAEPVSFANQVKPILVERCLACHSDKERFGGLSLEKFDDISDFVTPGDPEKSRLFVVVSGERAKMPRGGPPLKPEQIETLRAWIEQGAKNDAAAAKP
jgi:mono/diheme cytochrome c family protein